MSLPFDATLKDLAHDYPQDFEAAFRQEGPQPVRVLNVDLSTISAATDVALGNGDPLQRVVDLNFQSGPDPDLSERLLLYNALLHYRFKVPVHSVLVLLRPAADGPGLTGKLRYEGRKRRGKLVFTFEVVRLWRQPVQSILKGGLGTLPLAPLCRLPGNTTAEQALPGIIRRIDERLTQEATSADAARLWTAAFVLSGLRHDPSVALPLFRGVHGMKESTTYQWIVNEGRMEGRIEVLREMVLRLGQRRLGPPDDATKAVIQSATDVERLKRMTEQLLDLSTWQELLDTL
jgi:hypothetical protein